MKKPIVLLISLFVISCTNTNWDKTLLYGDWKVQEWTNTETNQKINAKMDFTFKEGDKYSVDYGGVKEEGTFWIMGDYLHTIEKGKAEKKVKITALDQDNLGFEMNRGGIIETVHLTR